MNKQCIIFQTQHTNLLFYLNIKFNKWMYKAINLNVSIYLNTFIDLVTYIPINISIYIHISYSGFPCEQLRKQICKPHKQNLPKQIHNYSKPNYNKNLCRWSLNNTGLPFMSLFICRFFSVNTHCNTTWLVEPWIQNWR